MNHPSVITIERRSAPPVVFAGPKLVPLELPVGGRCVYPNISLPGVADVDGRIRSALNRPLGSDPFPALLRSGMRLSLVLGDVTVGAGSSSFYAHALTLLVTCAAERGVTDIEIVLATGLDRKLRPRELRRLVGARIFKEFFPDRIRCHDAEDVANLVRVGALSDGTPVDLNRRVAESEWTVYVSARSLSEEGAHSRIARGLTSYRTLSAPAVSDPVVQSPQEGLQARIAEVASLLGHKLRVFCLESVQSRGASPAFQDVFSRSEEDLGPRERSLRSGLMLGHRYLPGRVGQRILGGRATGRESIIGVWAGQEPMVNEACLSLARDQFQVPVDRQCDVLIVPIAEQSRHSMGDLVNPLLAQALGAGAYFDQHRGAPLLRAQGTLILLHPMANRFTHPDHVASLDFVHAVLPKTRDSHELRARYEPRFALNPALTQMYRSSYAYHPSHPFLMWYRGESGRSHAGQVIVVGADNEAIPERFGFETAPSLAAALYRARGGVPRDLDVLCLPMPELVLAKVSGQA